MSPHSSQELPSAEAGCTLVSMFAVCLFVVRPWSYASP